MLLQFIPARGRKLHPLSRIGRIFLCCNLSPRGDGNIKNYSEQHIRFGCNLSPRGDGNAKMVPLTIKQLKLQFIPARGRKQNGFCRAHGIRSCNLSPRGDGNSIRPRDVHGYAMLQFIPARGRKHFLQRFNKCAAVSGLQFIPARGRKPLIQIRGHNGFNHVAIYPREGTETRCHDYPRCTGRSCNLSPRGDGNVAPLPFQRPVSRCNLSPRGDGNSTCFCVSVDIAASCNLSPRGDGNRSLRAPSGRVE